MNFERREGKFYSVARWVGALGKAREGSG